MDVNGATWRKPGMPDLARDALPTSNTPHLCIPKRNPRRDPRVLPAEPGAAMSPGTLGDSGDPSAAGGGNPPAAYTGVYLQQQV